MDDGPVMRVGIIQTGGIGDVIIALPIADHYLQLGHEIVWPIHEAYLNAFTRVKPEVRFLPVPPTPESSYRAPIKMLQGCDQVIPLYNFLAHDKVCDETLSKYLKFDEYKYAIAKVPFLHKWNLRIRRDMEREQELHRRLNIDRPYICVHTTSSIAKVGIKLPPEWSSYQIVEITPLTDSPFDWIYTLERAEKLVLLESCFSNLVEQLGLPNEKYLILKATGLQTPVFLNHWNRLVSEIVDGKATFRLV